MVLGDYGFTKRQKTIFEKGYKRNREIQILEEHVRGKIIWKASLEDTQSGAIEVATTMGALAGVNFDAPSLLSRSLEEEKEKSLKIQSEKEALQETLNQYIEQLKSQHSTAIQGLKKQIGQLTNKKDIVEAEVIKHAIKLDGIKDQLEENKEYQASFVFFRFIVHVIEGEAISCN